MGVPKMLKRIISLTLVSLLLLSALAACGDNASAPVSTGSDTSASADTTTAEETLFVPDSLPQLNFNGKKVTLFVREDNIAEEFYVPEATGDTVDDALYDRNSNIEDRFGAKLAFVASPGAFWENREDYMNTVKTSVLAGDKAFDIIAGLSVIMPILLQDGMFVDLLDVPHLDFEKPWWPASLLDELELYGKLYLASGEASLGVLSGMMCMFFNKTMIESSKLDDPYKLVQDGAWTIDKLEKMASSVYADTNGDGAVNAGDTYGFVMTNTNHVNNFIDAFDLKMVERDKDGTPKLVFGNEKVASAIERLCTMLKDVPGIALEKEGQTVYTNMFRDGLALFTSAEFKDNKILRDVTDDYGVIPYPKWDEAQADYYCASRSTFTLFGIPITADPEVSGAILEAFGSESYRTVSPAFYEVALKVKYSRDDISAQMYDLIKSSVRFSFGVTYSCVADNVSTLFKGKVREGNWASVWASREAPCTAALNNFLKVVKEFK